MYALSLSKDARILSVTFEEYASEGMTIVPEIPDGNAADYKYIEGQYVYDPLPAPPESKGPSQMDTMQAQIFYTAMKTGTLIGGNK